jgi:hypothetical protein
VTKKKKCLHCGSDDIVLISKHFKKWKCKKCKKPFLMTENAVLKSPPLESVEKKQTLKRKVAPRKAKIKRATNQLKWGDSEPADAQPRIIDIGPAGGIDSLWGGIGPAGNKYDKKR